MPFQPATLNSSECFLVTENASAADHLTKLHIGSRFMSAKQMGKPSLRKEMC